jgi:hypothetical protein
VRKAAKLQSWINFSMEKFMKRSGAALEKTASLRFGWGLEGRGLLYKLAS